MTTPENPPAFPNDRVRVIDLGVDKLTGDHVWGEEKEGGMTLRDYFAAAALQCVKGIYSNPAYPSEEHDQETHDFLATHAYGIADAMLRVRQP